MDKASGQSKRVGRRWASRGVIVLAAVIALAGAISFSVASLLPYARPYLTAVERLKQNPEALGALGTPISAGFPWGRVSFDDGSGEAELAFAATGPKRSGTVYLEAPRDLGLWRLTRLELTLDGRKRSIDLADHARLPPLDPLRLD